MSKKISEPTENPRERAFLVGVELRNEQNLLSIEDSLDELSLLCETAGIDIVGETIQRLQHPNPETFIGSGKVDEIIMLAEDTNADIIIFDNELSPRHLRELEKRFGANIRIIDRTALILDIFALHAHSREGILQVELAQYEYRLPRLTHAWTHLVRQAGGGGGRTGSQGGVGLRGPGETQLEVDRREINRKIINLKQELEKVRAHRMRYRAKRKRNQIPVIALVGYTNSGKSTFINTISNANVLVADQLFATLDPTTRRVVLPEKHQVLFTDTVGFIQKLPTQLVAAFRATLEEISEADLLINILDITHPNAMSHWKSVQQTLNEINADHIPVLTVLNKIDRLPDQEFVQSTISQYQDAFAISALKGDGVNNLLSNIEAVLFEKMIPISVHLQYQHGDIISMFHEFGQVIRIEHVRGGVFLQGKIPGRLLASFQPFLVKEDAGD